MKYTIELYRPRNFKVIIVGCGGTGSFVAEGLCRVLMGTDIPILLFDHDRVEEPNLGRQNFYGDDLGKFKSQALAERLARQFQRKVGYSVYPFMHGMMEGSGSNYLRSRLIEGLIIGCVDNAAARREISKSLGYTHNWWLDSGNGFSSGQVLLGNTLSRDYFDGAFKNTGQVVKLPSPGLQAPSLLAPPTVVVAPLDCAEAVATDEQSPFINQAMATLVVTMVHKLLTHSLAWMGAYIDLDAGTLQVVRAEPEVVAKMCSMKVDVLISKPNSKNDNDEIVGANSFI